MAPMRNNDGTLESRSLYNLALENINRSNYHEALKHLQKALHIAPQNPFYLSYYGFCLARVRREYDAALNLCNKALKARPDDPVIQVNLGRVWKLKGDNLTAYRTFLQAWEQNKRHPAPATELSRMGIRRRPVIPFLPRSNWCNKYLGRLRAVVERAVTGRRRI